MNERKSASKHGSPKGEAVKPFAKRAGKADRKTGYKGLFALAAEQSSRAYAKKPAWVDPDDAPEWTQEQFERADLYHGDKLIRRGRPPSASPKQALKLRIDPDVVEHFRATGPGWQTRINAALRRAAKLPKTG
jgi:uncharacterized protein (DUF4415 family)